MEQAPNESIWADGVPEKVDEKYIMKFQDLLRLSIKAFIDKYAIPKGYKIEHVNDDPNKLPNVVIKKDGKVYGIVIVAWFGNTYGFLKPEVRVPFVRFLKQQNAKPILAPFLIRSVDPERTAKGLALKGDLFNVTLRGFVELTDDENQDHTMNDPIALTIEELDEKPEATA